jgi:hypothetical protein
MRWYLVKRQHSYKVSGFFLASFALFARPAGKYTWVGKKEKEFLWTGILIEFHLSLGQSGKQGWCNNIKHLRYYYF